MDLYGLKNNLLLSTVCSSTHIQNTHNIKLKFEKYGKQKDCLTD